MIVRESTFNEGICVVEAKGRLDAAAASQGRNLRKSRALLTNLTSYDIISKCVF
jgi:hypothetical protein